MREAAQAGFQTADIDGRIRERAAREHGIDGHGAVGTLAAHAARGVSIVVTALFGCRVVRDHRVDVAGVDEHGVARTTHFDEVVLVAEVGLGQDGDAETGVFQHARDDGRAEGRVVDVRVTGHQQKITVIPPAGFHVRP